MSDSESDGPPPPARQGTGLYRRMTMSSSVSNLAGTHKFGHSPSSLNASPMSHQASFQWDACSSFRLYATQSKGLMATSRRGTNFLVDVEHSVSTAEELTSAFKALKDYICLYGTLTVSSDSQLPVNIRKGKLIGSGGFADVYCGINIQTGELVAIKEIKISDTSNRKELRAVEEEFELLRQLRHANVVRYILFEQSVSQKMCRIVMEFMAGGSAQQLLQKFGPLTEAIVKKFATDMLNGIAFIHREGIIHRDIKPANILVGATGQVKLADFGCSKRITELTTTGCIIGTPVYMAPEFIRGQTTPKADIWAMGCTLFELATGLPPWHHTRVKDNIPLMFYITTSSESPTVLPVDDPRSFSDGFIDFLEKCFERNVAKRMSADELLQHHWILDTSLVDAMQREIEDVAMPQSVELCHTLCTETMVEVQELDSRASTPRLSEMREPEDMAASPPRRENSSSRTSPQYLAALPQFTGALDGSTSLLASTYLPQAAASGGGNQYLLLNQETGNLEFAKCDDTPEAEVPTIEEPTSGKTSPKGAFKPSRQRVSFVDDTRSESPASSALAVMGPGGVPQVSLEGPVHMSFSFKAGGGDVVSVGLDIQPEDVTCRIVDKRPSFVVAMNEHIRGQLNSKMTELSNRNSCTALDEFSE